jgi:hypothetical protein
MITIVHVFISGTPRIDPAQGSGTYFYPWSRMPARFHRHGRQWTPSGHRRQISERYLAFLKGVTQLVVDCLKLL